MKKDDQCCIDDFLKDNPCELLQIENRGELSIPPEYSFAVSCIAPQLYTNISAE